MPGFTAIFPPSYVVGLGNPTRIDGRVPARACYARNGVGSNSRPLVTPSRVGERIQMNAAKEIGLSEDNGMEPFSKLTEAVKAKLETKFPSSEQEQAATLLLQYTFGREIERVHLDALEVCESSLVKLRKLVELANQDYRDLIMAAEYDIIDGEPILKPKFAGRYG